MNQCRIKCDNFEISYLCFRSETNCHERGSFQHNEAMFYEVLSNFCFDFALPSKSGKILALFHKIFDRLGCYVVLFDMIFQLQIVSELQPYIQGSCRN